MIIFEENTLMVNEIKAIRKAVGWSDFTILQLEEALAKTVYSVVVKNEKNEAVAMGRLIGDGIYYLICDVAVVPEYQNQGIGSKIINSIVDHVKDNLALNQRCSIQLIAAKGKESFYQKLGFRALPNENSGHGMQMFIKKKDI